MTKENQLLAEKLKKAKKVGSSILDKDSTINNRKISSSLLDSTISSCKEISHNKAAEFPSEDFLASFLFVPDFNTILLN